MIVMTKTQALELLRKPLNEMSDAEKKLLQQAIKMVGYFGPSAS